MRLLAVFMQIASFNQLWLLLRNVKQVTRMRRSSKHERHVFSLLETCMLIDSNPAASAALCCQRLLRPSRRQALTGQAGICSGYASWHKASVE